MTTRVQPQQTQMLPVLAEHIECTPGVCGGKPRIVGHRITVQHIVLWHDHDGLSPDQIVSRYPGLTLADVHAALAYYYDHPDEIQAQIRADAECAAQMRLTCPSPLQEKRRAAHATNDSLSPG